MARSSRGRRAAQPSKRPTSSRRRQPQRSWLARNQLLVAVLAVVAVAAATFLALGGGNAADGDGGAGGLTGGDFHSIVVDPSQRDRIFVGGHQAVSVSTDGGATWREIVSLRDADAMGWAFTSDAIYVSGHPGLTRSTDGGRTFQRVNDGLPHTDLHAFGGTDRVLYAASPAVGVFASTNGRSWEPRTDRAGQSFFGRILVDPDDDEHLFAADASAGVAESSDGGRTWRRVDTGLRSATWISRGGDGMEVLVASGQDGAVRSADGGRTWRPLELPPGATLVEAVPGNVKLLYAGIHRGTRVEVRVSSDGGERWLRQ